MRRVEMAERQMSEESWLIRVKDIFDVSNGMCAKKILEATVRVPEPVARVKREAYIPQILSLGPYHHRRIDLSRMEKFKLVIARLFSDQISENRFRAIVESIKQLNSKVADFYDITIQEIGPETLAWMMALDALFILYCLHSRFKLPLHGRIRSLESNLSEVSIKCDVLKLENQIPLFVLERMYVEVESRLNDVDAHRCGETQRRGLRRQLKDALRNACSQFSPFGLCLTHGNLDVDDEDNTHFLGLLHKHISEIVEIAPEPKRGPNPSKLVWIWEEIQHYIIFNLFALLLLPFGRNPYAARNGESRKYNATELWRAGILFKPIEGHSDKIMFDHWTDTVYIPTISISDAAEVILRNLLAFEFNNPLLKATVATYIQLMDCLIDTPDDATLLTKCGIIKRESILITDDDIVKMWEGMCRPFIQDFSEPPKVFKSLLELSLRRNATKIKCRQVWAEFWETHLSKPWRVTALLATIFVLLMTIAQTYCTFRECNHH